VSCELPDNHWWSQDGRWELIDDFWGQLNSVRSKIRERKHDISFAEFLGRQRGIPPRTRRLARTFVEGYHAAHADQMSAMALKMSDEEQSDSSARNRQFRLTNGQDALIDWLRSGLHPQRADVRLST